MSQSGKPTTRAKAEEVPEETKPQAYDRLKSKKKPVTRTVRICLDSELVDQLSAAQQELQFSQIDAERAHDNGEVQERFKAVKAQVEELERTAAEHSVKFVFRNISRKTYEDMLFEWPPTEAQKEKLAARGEDPDQLDFDADHFPAELVAAAMVEPEFTLEQVYDLFADPNWSSAEVMALFQTAQDAQFHSTVVNLGKG